MGRAPLDTRIKCPFCGMRTWERDYARFMSDHDRADGKKCKRAALRAALEQVAADYAGSPQPHAFHKHGNESGLLWNANKGKTTCNVCNKPKSDAIHTEAA